MTLKTCAYCDTTDARVVLWLGPNNFEGGRLEYAHLDCWEEHTGRRDEPFRKEEVCPRIASRLAPGRTD
jgi:hypothetical protein